MPVEPVSVCLISPCVVMQMDPMQEEATKQQMMLERFQEENPGFDFSNAEFNGAAPNPRTFMGGIKYT